MFRRVLIANRGEVAARVMRTCRRMGVEVVAVASKADAELGWLHDVDEVVLIGGAKAARSYLDQGAILEAARRTGATAIHPGWGFLAENATFAARCEAAGITFIGPGPAVIAAMGDKIEARASMSALGMPLIPGSPGPVADLDAAREQAEQIGYPVLMKAAAGGGGRGMRRVHGPDALQAGFREASAESQAAFGNGELYMERLIEEGRHIEFQVLVDAFGNAVHLGERECSIQRRHQKLIEESPSPAVSPEQRAEMGALVAGIAARAGYRSAGTIEMLRDPTGALYFMEMNTRLQVEHPVSELVTGFDLVEQQLRVAANQPLSFTQDDVRFQGHAIEVRINAEDPARGFQPTPGRISRLELPRGEGLRVDTHLRPGDRVSPHYDSMVCKLIAHGADRTQALERMRAALAACRIEGVSTTIPVHQKVLADPAFIAGDYHTGSLTRILEER
ncbi:MAG: acetyl-CoA carboxylase biotin carboxylase subunit [Alphaproteobacteria bacterium]|nr:acetyl-CoA carboxylase biotin carboxylase subunit [Alphaproteobacteria bacterium]